MPIDKILENANKLFLDKKFNEACVLYDKVLDSDPTNLTALNNKGYSLNKLRKYEDAILCYDIALGYFPDDKTLLINKISALRKTKQFETALQYCNDILNSKIDNITLYHKERILFSIERYEESIKCCDRILKDYPQNSEVLFDKACSLAKINKIAESTEFLIMAIKIEPHLKIKAKNHSIFSELKPIQELLLGLD